MSIEAIIFDMDDLMIDSHPAHMKVFEIVLDEYGVSLSDPENQLTKEEERSFFGLKIKDIFAYLQKKYELGDKTSVDELYARFNELLLPIFEECIEAMPGLYDTINVFHNNGYKLVIASSAKRVKIDVVLKKLNLIDKFDVIVSGEDEIEHGKPEPDIFLKAAEKINTEPRNCLVLEDAKNGVSAAKAAGMYCIGVHNKFAYDRLGIMQDLGKADLEVNGLSEISLDYIRKLK